MERRALVTLALLSLTACTGYLQPRVGSADRLPGHSTSDSRTLVGRVEAWPRAVQSTGAELTQGSAVVLIEPGSGQAIASALTGDTGAFTLALPVAFTPTEGAVYLLEAFKGQAMGGVAGRAGATVGRMRTLLGYQGGQWTHLGSASAGDPILVTGATTTLALVASLRGLATADQLALMGRASDQARSYLPPSGGSVSLGEYQAVRGWIDQLLADDQDPVESLTYNSASTGPVEQRYGRKPRSLVLHTTFTPAAPQPGDLVTFSGQNFPTPRAGIRCSIGNTPLGTWTLNPDRTQLTIAMPPVQLVGAFTVTDGLTTWTGPTVTVGPLTQQSFRDFEDANVTAFQPNNAQSGSGTVTTLTGGPTGRYLTATTLNHISNLPSTTAYGVWEFDTIQRTHHEYWPVQNNTTTWMSSGEGYLLWKDYDGITRFSRVTGGGTTHIAQYTSLVAEGVWWRCRIERARNGLWRIFENGRPMTEVVDNTLTSSSYFGQFFWDVPANTGGVDNLRISSW
jgi:hypothetical protein